MATLANPITPTPTTMRTRWPRAHILIILGLWLVIYAAALSTPPLLDDADSTHAQAAQAMLTTGDWVTLHVDGIRYLEKPPLPYWIDAISLRLFAPRQHFEGANPLHPVISSRPALSAEAFAIHLPLALTILGLALLGYAWSRRAFPSERFGNNAALYAAVFILTSAGVFLFTRVFIPDALLSLLLAFSLYALLRSLEGSSVLSTRTHPSASEISTEAHPRNSVISTGGALLRRSGETPVFPTSPEAAALRSRTPIPQHLWPYALWLSLALAVLTKGLVSLVFIFGTALLFLFWTDQLRHWRRLRPATGILLFLVVAAPWHILAGLRNTGGANGHGFFWFYFINEHVLRFLGRRIPRDYNKLPGYLYWSLHLVWLFPWSLFAPAALIYAWRNRKLLRRQPGAYAPLPHAGDQDAPSNKQIGRHNEQISQNNEQEAQHFSPGSPTPSPIGGFSSWNAPSFTRQTILILLIFSALVLVFFSLSTNQEYYTFPVYLPLLMLLAAALSAIERKPTSPLDPTLRRALTFTFAAFTALGLAIAAALAYGLWSARHLPFVADIGELLAHRNVGDYTLSMSHFFDLTGPSFAALRLPATLALTAFLIGPPIAWFLHTRRRSLAAILTVAFTSATFLIAAHIAFARFSPMLSSANFAATIQTLERTGRISPNNEVLIFGDQAFGSSIPFYLDRRVFLVDGRTTSMLFGSTFPDAPPIFLTSAQLFAQWGHGPRKLLFVPLEQRDAVDHLLGFRQVILQQTSGKALITDRPLDQ